MTRARLWGRFLIALALFAGWIGYLGYLVASRPQTPGGAPLVVSRAQLLASDADVIAHVESPGRPVKIEKVLWARDGVALAPGQELKVDNIDDAQPRAAGPDAAVPPKDFTGPGTYLIPLTYYPTSKRFGVCRVPPSPGFHAPPANARGAVFEPATRWPVYRVYPATEEAEAQYARHKPGL